jgi:hypothetical protein
MLRGKQQVFHISVCERAWMLSCACVRACVRACVFVAVGTGTRACVCAQVALLIQHATRRHIVIYGLSGYKSYLMFRSSGLRDKHKMGSALRIDWVLLPKHVAVKR